MKFLKKYTTRWHDTDANRTVRPTELLVYMQETSNAHLDAMEHNLDKLRDEHSLAFLLSKTKIAIYEPLYFPEDITVETFTAESRAFGFSRFYRILQGERVIAAADTTWALLNLKTKQLCRADSFDFGFEHEPAIDIGIPARFTVPRGDAIKLVGERRIVYSDLDYNMHMNNTRYADMLCDFIPIDDVPRISGISISYLHEASFENVLSIYRADLEGKYDFRAIDQNGNVCIEAEILLK